MSETGMIFAQDWSGIDSTKIEERNDPVHGPVTVFHDVVIAREMVQPYEIDGKTLMAYKSADELERYWPWVDGRWAVAGRHPSTPVVVSPGDIAGRTVNPRFVKNLKDTKTGRPNIRGILVDLEVFNNRVAPDILSGMKDGSLPSVSIGFLYGKEMTPGKWNGAAYDLRQVNMFHDHTAFGIRKGRCAFPACGIGADIMFNLEVQRLNEGYSDRQVKDMESLIVGHDPEETEEFIRIDNPGAGECEVTATIVISEEQGIQALYCGGADDKIVRTYIFAKEKGWTMEKAQTWVKEHKESEGDAYFARLIEIDTLAKAADQEGEGPRNDSERAMAHFGISQEVWDSLSDKAKAALIAALPDRGAGGNEPGADTEFSECVEAEMAKGKSREEAEKTCRAKEPTETSDMPEDDPGFQACVDLQLSKGMSQEEAEAFCRDKPATPDPQPEVTMSGDKDIDEVARSKRLLADPRRRVDLISSLK